MAEQTEIAELRAALVRVEAERDELRGILVDIREWSELTLNDDLMKRCRQLEDALRYVLAVLPAPAWNDKRVLVWSLVDQERISQALSSTPATPTPGA